MDVKVEQYCVIQYCVCCGLMVIQTVYEMQGAYQNECLNKRTIAMAQGLSKRMWVDRKAK